MLKVSQRVKNVSLSPTYSILDKVRELKSQGKDIIDLGGGEPSFKTPKHITSFAITSLHDGNTHYTPSRGNPSLLKAVSNYLTNSKKIESFPDENLIITPSAKHALYITLMTILDPGDEIIIPTPSWVSYKAMAELANATPVLVPMHNSYNFELSRSLLEEKVTSKTKAILINNPNNPTGRILNKSELEMLRQFSIDHDIFVIMDEIYEKVIFDGNTHTSLASMPQMKERTITINGFSKAWAMTGWRLGYVCAHAPIINEMLKVQQHSVGCAGSFVQSGGLMALIGDQNCQIDMVLEYQKRRNFLYKNLSKIDGITCLMPDSALYIYADISGLNIGNGTQVANWFLENAGVAVTPGIAFCPQGDSYIRLSFSSSMEQLEVAANRINKSIERLQLEYLNKVEIV
ncbi:pyridoxal phosphate-dependent aminotransferase [Vibrio spartinae]|uniref:Aminotransferase n=1 Tax=Vibrio spartinae TaxID=1918945 RepID=A0A1N6MBZ4_9VIBR|nr:pyridoxal phosphate-dependent aminotransferase [Vibrio spartinae]SIO96886.1 Aspartate aminotransferase [Vibrio spartinae]